jgi:hypothetical protein
VESEGLEEEYLLENFVASEEADDEEASWALLPLVFL